MKNFPYSDNSDDLLIDLYVQSFEHATAEEVDEELRLANIDPRTDPEWRRKLLDFLAAELRALQPADRARVLLAARQHGEPAADEPSAIILDAGDLQFRYTPSDTPGILVTGAIPDTAARLVLTFSEKTFRLTRTDYGWLAQGLSRRALATYRKQYEDHAAADLFRIESEIQSG
jgi:hypothetical protein